MAASSGLAGAATRVSGGVASAASTIQVDTTTDDASLNACTSADDDCSLRGAITNANADPDSTITFASSVTGSIVLARPLPPSRQAEQCQGPGTVSWRSTEMYAERVFTVDTTAAAVRISDLKITKAGSVRGRCRRAGRQFADPLPSSSRQQPRQGRTHNYSPLTIDASTFPDDGRGSGPTKYDGVYLARLAYPPAPG